MKKIIAIHGLMGVGKDEVGAYIARTLIESGQYVENQRFAQCVKENVSNLTGIPMTQMPSDYTNAIFDFTREQKAMWLDDWGMTLGRLLQVYATEGVRDQVHQDAWILALKPKLQSDAVHVITDMRFLNEFVHVKGLDAITIKVKRDRGVENETRSAEHISESGLPDPYFHHIIENDGTLEQLFEKVNVILWDEGLIKRA